MVKGARDNEAVLAPPEPVDAAYERDFYTWSQEQARLLRAGLWTAVDRENVAEEIESLGREQFNKLESALRVLLLHVRKSRNTGEATWTCGRRWRSRRASRWR